MTADGPHAGARPSPEVDSDRARRALLAHMRHDLRTPVNAVIGYNEIHAAGNRLLSLIDDILKLSQMESGHLELDMEASGLGSCWTS